MFEKVKLICLTDAEGKRSWGGDPACIYSRSQLASLLLIGEELPEEIIFDGSLKEFIRLFPERTPDESKDRINEYLEAGVAEWTGKAWECFTCRVAVLGRCSGFYLSIVNKKDLK